MIVIVSGLPRSGTSMMMKMLEAGGMDLLVDNVRTADDDNPRGYYEFEPVKKIEEDDSWLEGAEGKAVKMVSALLPKLPSNREYRIVFMRRRIEEVLASQTVMLKRRGAEKSGRSDAEMGDLLSKHLAQVERWLSQQENIKVQYVDYNQILLDPTHGAGMVAGFLGDELDPRKMAAVIEPSLYRQRGGAG